MIKLTPEEGFLVTRKLDEFDLIGVNEFSNDLFDGSALSRRFQRILMKKRQKIIRKCVSFLANKLF